MFAYLFIAIVEETVRVLSLFCRERLGVRFITVAYRITKEPIILDNRFPNRRLEIRVTFKRNVMIKY